MVRSHLEAIKSCYEKQIAKHPDLQGSVEVGWTVEKDGSVSGARVVKSTINEKNVESCIVAEVGRWRFITAPERTVVARFPFVFKTMLPIPADAPKVTIWVSRAGVIELNGKQADLPAVKAALTELGKRNGAIVVYGQDEPHARPDRREDRRPGVPEQAPLPDEHQARLLRRDPTRRNGEALTSGEPRDEQRAAADGDGQAQDLDAAIAEPGGAAGGEREGQQRSTRTPS